LDKKPKPFNNPFGAVKLAKPAAAPTQPAKPKPPVAPPAPSDDDAALFLESVGEVAPVRSKPTRAEPPPPPPSHRAEAEEEALLQLSELVVGDGALEVAGDDAYLEGAAPGLDPQIVRKLHRGDYPVRATLELHGLTEAQAKAQLQVFLLASRQRRFRCVRVILGRGLHTDGSPPVLPALDAGVQRWLTQGRISKQVLAFATAQPRDGGAGAVYVLLRR